MPNPILNSAYLAPERDGALNPTLWQTNPGMAFWASMKGRGLFGAIAAKEQAGLDFEKSLLDKARLEAQNKRTNELLTASPKDEILSPADLNRYRAGLLATHGLLDEANKLGDLGNKLDNKLVFKDGVWYDERTGRPVRGGALMNQQGYGATMSVGENDQISAGPLPGSAELYSQQQNIGEEAKARHDLQRVPATSPTSQPRFDSRLNLLRGGGAAGMSPVQEYGVAADAAQSLEVSKNYGTIFNTLQNAAMQNRESAGRL
jgi:hypothetical protein